VLSFLYAVIRLIIVFLAIINPVNPRFANLGGHYILSIAFVSVTCSRFSCSDIYPVAEEKLKAGTLGIAPNRANTPPTLVVYL
jgi:hypothetical protein